MTVEAMQELATENGGKLPANSWPGCYPLFYMDSENSILCANCAQDSLENRDDWAIEHAPILCDIHWEGAPLSCDQCSAAIDSAYGNPNGCPNCGGQWGPVEVARMTGNPYRACTNYPECKTVTLDLED